MKLRRPRRHARMELLPLMDVVFLVLVFLIYAMMVMVVHTGMPVALPTSKSVQPEQIVTLALTIEADGKLWLDKNPVTLNNLKESIEADMRERGANDNDEPSLQIFADATLPYQKLFHVLDELKRAGLKKISLQAKETN